MVTDVMAGGYSSVFRGSGIEFDEVREFAEGDELRASTGTSPRAPAGRSSRSSSRSASSRCRR
jgi:hypothetical protein